MFLTHPMVLMVCAVSLVIFAMAVTPVAAADPPATYLLEGPALMETRRRVLADDPDVAEGIAELRRRADRHMRGELWAVTSKPAPGPSGDKHDYVSLSSYFWPDSASPDGLPYVHHDGKLNPETREYDRTRLDGMSDLVYTLALAHYLTGEQRYGERAAEQLRVWFLNEATRMNPHLRNAQMIKGKNDGNPWGLIETERLTQVVDAVGLLRATGAWPDQDDRRLRQWFDEYLTWLLTSEMGQKEAAAPNNHGTLYDVQTAVFALFTGRDGLAREIIEKVKSRRVATQIEPDGSQPRELRRTRAWSYSQLNLTGLFHLARLGEHVGVELWRYRTDDGRSIRGALDWLLPYATGKPWEHQQITRQAFEPTVWLLRHAANIYREPTYELAIQRLPGVERQIAWINLLHPPRDK